MPDDVDVRAFDRASSRSVICASSWLNAECTDAMTMSSCARQSSARSMRAVGADVALDARQQRDAVEPSAVERAHRAGMRERARLVEAVGHRQRLAVIGDRDVFEPGVARGQRHGSTSSLPSVAVVCMCRSPRRSCRSIEARQRAVPRPPRSRRGSRAVPAAIHAQPERLVDALPRSRRQRESSSSTRNRPYSFSLSRAGCARSRSAMLCAFEPVKYCIAAPRLLGGHQPQIGLEPAPEQHARLGSPCAEDALHAARTPRTPPSPSAGAPAARMSRSPQVSQPRRRLPTTSKVASGRRLAQIRDQRARLLPRLGHQVASGERWRAPRSPCRISASFFGAHPLDAANAPVARRRFELVQRADAQFACRAARRSSGRRPAGAAGRAWSAGNSCEQLPVIRGAAGRRPISAILRREVLADARAAPRRSAGASAATRSPQCATICDGVAVRADLERVLALISSRSAISARTRAMARFSTADPVARRRRHAGRGHYNDPRLSAGPALRLVADSAFRVPIDVAARHPPTRGPAHDGRVSRALHPRRNCARSPATSTSAASCCLRATSRSPSRLPSSRARRRSSRGELPLWVAVDQEGGRVARLQGAVHRVAADADARSRGDLELAARFARALAPSCAAVGITLDFAPVLDVLTATRRTRRSATARFPIRPRTSRASARR